MSEQIRSEYNRRAANNRRLCAERSQIEIIRFFGFFGYPRSIVYDVVAKYICLRKKSEKDSANLTRKNHLKEKSARTPAIIERAHFRGPKAVSDEISKKPWVWVTTMKLLKRIYANPLWYKFDKCFPRLPRTELLAVICF